MRSRTYLPHLVLALFALASVLALSNRAALADQPQPTCKTQKKCFTAAVNSYVYGYPLVMMGLTDAVTSNVHNATDVFGRAPKNQFANGTALPDSTYTDVVLPNVNTLYSLAWLDLSKEPIILHIPDMGQRFFLFETVDAWTNVIPNSPGSRTGAQAGDYAYVGPNFTGQLPNDLTEVIHMPTNIVWVIGRTYTTGAPDDINYITSTLQSQYSLTPLSFYHQPYSPPTNSPIDTTVDMTTPPFQQVANMGACAFFGKLAALMTKNPPLAADTRAVKRLARIGVVPGIDFDCSKIDRATLATLELATREGSKIVTQAAKKPPAKLINGWQMPLNLGDFGVRYLLRAATARNGIGANYYLDAVYAGTKLDNKGNALNGANNYTLTFPANQLPPATNNAFWSVTMYNTGLENLVPNPIGRYALGNPTVQNHDYCKNSDNSVTFYIQNVAPTDTTSTAYCNWLPSPTGAYLLVMRIYWPGPTVFDHTWLPPAVKIAN